MIGGLKERLEKELRITKKLPFKEIVTRPEGEYLTWIGGGILGSMSTMEEKWVTKEGYEEYGKDVVGRRRQGGYF